MKKKRNLRFKRKDFIAVLVSLSVCAFWIFLFLNDISREQTKKNEVSIASVINQEKYAERKFADRTVWARIKEQTPLYNGDYIRIEPNSFSEIEFDDGTKVRISENSLVQIFVDENGNYATISDRGGVLIDSTNGSSKFYVIDEQGKKVNIEQGSVISLESNSDRLDVTVQKGRASYIDKNGVESFATNGSGLLINGDETTERKMLVVLRPPQNAVLMNPENGECSVQFSWSKNNPGIQFVKIELSQDENFENGKKEFVRNADDSESFIPASNGNYFWRMTAQNKNGTDIEKSVQSGKFLIFDGTKPRARSPAFGETVSTRNGSLVLFKWEKKNFAEFYEITVAENPGLENPVVQQRVFGETAKFNLKEGTYYWAVRAFYSLNGYGFGNSSDVLPFTVTLKEELSPPVILLPEKNFVFYRPRKKSKEKDAVKNNIYFSWKSEDRFSEYIFTLSQTADFSSVEKREVLKENFYSVPFNEMSDDGFYYWKVGARTNSGAETKESDVFSFVISSNKVLEEKLIYPPDGMHFSESEIKSASFLWELEEADSYIVEFSSDSNFGNVALQKETDIESVSDIALNPGVWYWRVADGDERARTTKQGVFVVDEPPHVPLPVELSLPEDKIVFKGEDVLKTPVRFEWSSNEKIKSAVFVLKRKNASGSFETVLTRNSLSKVQTVSRLQRGSYAWSIQAVAEDGTDISSGERQLEILSPAKLPAPVLIRPKQKTIFDTEYVKTNSVILFEWQNVPGATKYSFLLQKNNDGKLATVARKEFDSSTLSYTLDDLSVLSNGNFVWTVTAENRAGDGFLIQSGNPGTGEFSVQVQLPGKIKILDVGTQYGE